MKLFVILIFFYTFASAKIFLLMKKGTICVITCLFFVVNSTVLAQEDTSKVFMNSEGMTLDSLYDIVNDPHITYKEKIKIFFQCKHKRNSQQEKQTSTINALLSDSKRNKDINGLLYGYIYLADLNKEWSNEDMFNIYIDSAELYADNSTNPLALAGYHYTKGTQAINAPYGKKEGYKQFEKAIEYYSQTGIDIQSISYILYNITAYTANQPDTIFAKNLIDKIVIILQKEYSPFIDFSLCAMKSDLYSNYFNETRKESMIDSAIFYENKRIELFLSNRDTLPEIGRAHV